VRTPTTKNGAVPRSASSVADVEHRSLRLAGGWGLVAAAAEIPHVLEDSRAGVGATLGLSPAMVGVLGFLLVAAGVAVSALALLTRRPAARAIVVLAVVWIIGVLVDHGGGLLRPTTFRSGLASSLPLYAILLANLMAALHSLPPALPRRLDALKIDGPTAWAALQSGGVVLLDVRTPAERRRGVIPGAVTDMRALRARLPVAVVCSHGGRSLAVTRRLRARGIVAHSVAGGTTAWRRAQLPWVG
jgi:rhodanese-related sulfurtransferase